MKLPLFLSLAAVSAAAAADSSPAPRLFRILDQDADGKITPVEVANSPWVARLDTDKDGTVSAAEFQAGWDNFAELRALLAARFPRVIADPGKKPAPPAEDSPRQAAKELSPIASGIGNLIPDVALATLDGKPCK